MQSGRQQRRRSDLWVDDNRDGLAWGEVVDVVESGVRKGRKRKGEREIEAWKLDSQVTRKGNEGTATRVTR